MTSPLLNIRHVRTADACARYRRVRIRSHDERPVNENSNGKDRLKDRSCEMKLALINSLAIIIVFVFSIVTPGIGQVVNRRSFLRNFCNYHDSLYTQYFVVARQQVPWKRTCHQASCSYGGGTGQPEWKGAIYQGDAGKTLRSNNRISHI